MTLILTMLRCPDGVPPETRRLEAGALSIGRSPDSDWVLPDPDRVLSKRHCIVSLQKDGWEVLDTSTNGTFVNHEVPCVGPKVRRVLRDGDRLGFGTYEIEVSIPPAADPAGMTPWRETEAALDVSWTDAAPSPPRSDDDELGIGLRLPDSLGWDAPPAPPAEPMADRSAEVAGFFRAPRTSLDMLPMDWDTEGSVVASPMPSPAVPATEPPPPDIAEPAAPVTPVTPTNGAEPGLTAFLAGAGASGPLPADPAATLHALGAAFRAAISGLRRMMMARAAVKSEFRIEQTVIRPVGNNPLKFSANDDDALQALLKTGGRREMTAEQAISETLRDMRLHELAVSSAMQHAARELVAKLDPAALLRTLPPEPLDRLPGQRDRRAWSAYRALHSQTERTLTDDFDSLFGKSFVRAYERAMAEFAAQDGDHDFKDDSRRKLT